MSQQFPLRMPSRMTGRCDSRTLLVAVTETVTLRYSHAQVMPSLDPSFNTWEVFLYSKHSASSIPSLNFSKLYPPKTQVRNTKQPKLLGTCSGPHPTEGTLEFIPQEVYKPPPFLTQSTFTPMQHLLLAGFFGLFQSLCHINSRTSPERKAATSLAYTDDLKQRKPPANAYKMLISVSGILRRSLSTHQIVF